MTHRKITFTWYLLLIFAQISLLYFKSKHTKIPRQMNLRACQLVSARSSPTQASFSLNFICLVLSAGRSVDCSFLTVSFAPFFCCWDPPASGPLQAMRGFAMVRGYAPSWVSSSSVVALATPSRATPWFATLTNRIVRSAKLKGGKPPSNYPLGVHSSPLRG